MLASISKKLGAGAGVIGAIWALPDGGNPWVMGAKALACGAVGVAYMHAQGRVDLALATGAGFNPKTGKATPPPLGVSEGASPK